MKLLLAGLHRHRKYDLYLWAINYHNRYPAIWMCTSSLIVIIIIVHHEYHKQVLTHSEQTLIQNKITIIDHHNHYYGNHMNIHHD